MSRSSYLKSALSIAMLAMLLTGCWDIKDLQEVNYLTAIGFDIEEGEFVIYGQLIDFASVAKSESPKSGTIPTWIGKGKGKTLVDAIDDLYRTSQLRIFYGHVNAIVVGERVLSDKDAMHQVAQFQARFHEMRFTPWMFGTKETLSKVLSATSIFDFSPRVSVLHQPTEITRQRSVVRPMNIRMFALEMNEPSHTTLLPSLDLTEANWSKGDKPQSMLTIDGVYIFEEERLLTWLPVEKMQPMSWIDPEAYRGYLAIESGGEPLAAVVLEIPKVQIDPRVRNGKAEYTLKVSLAGTIVMILKPITEDELERESEKLVMEQIRELYDEGVKHNADLLHLKTALYRKKNQEWKMLKERDALKLTPESLTDIEVSVKIERSGNLKGHSLLG